MTHEDERAELSPALKEIRAELAQLRRDVQCLCTALALSGPGWRCPPHLRRAFAAARYVTGASLTPGVDALRAARQAIATDVQNVSIGAPRLLTEHDDA